jgi:hypothetical protein
MAQTESLRSLAARVGGYARASKYDGREVTRAAREAYLKKWVNQVDPERVLPEPERLRRAESALKAHMAQLALKSAKARAARKAGAPT